MKVLVTGGAGFIGSHLVDALVDEAEVHVLDDLSTGRASLVHPRARLHHGSLLDPVAVERAIAGATFVFHQAALSSVVRSVRDPVASHEANATGTLRVLDAARAAGVTKVVVASSSSVYGDTPTLPKHEGMPAAPRSPYAASKLAAESYAIAYHHAFDLRATALRYFNVYGPRQRADGAYPAVVAAFVDRALRNEPLVLHGDGSQTRDLTFVKDVVTANLLAARSTASDGAMINVGSGRSVPLRELARKVVASTGSASRIEHAPAREGDVRHSLASLDRAREMLGYEPATTLDAGIEATVAWRRGLPLTEATP